MPLSFLIAGPVGQALQFFVFGPRDLYRPGETVLLNGLLRDADGQQVTAQPIKVEVRRPDQQISREFVLRPMTHGLYSIPTTHSCEMAPTGRWQIIARLIGGGIEQVYDILVEDFLPERLSPELQAAATPIYTASGIASGGGRAVIWMAHRRRVIASRVSSMYGRCAKQLAVCQAFSLVSIAMMKRSSRRLIWMKWSLMQRVAPKSKLTANGQQVHHR